MANEFKTYRSSVTGAVGSYHPRLAASFPDLVEVEEGTKPLAYTPIPAEAVEALRAEAAGSDDGNETSDDAPDPDPAPSTRQRKGKQS